MALTKSEELWKGGPLDDEVFVVQQFCQRVVVLIDTIEVRRL